MSLEKSVRERSPISNSILNNRVTQYCDLLNIIVDEQNSFRKERSCVDHTYILTSIIKNRMNKTLSTYCVFFQC